MYVPKPVSICRVQSSVVGPLHWLRSSSSWLSSSTFCPSSLHTLRLYSSSPINRPNNSNSNSAPKGGVEDSTPMEATFNSLLQHYTERGDRQKVLEVLAQMNQKGLRRELRVWKGQGASAGLPGGVGGGTSWGSAKSNEKVKTHEEVTERHLVSFLGGGDLAQVAGATESMHLPWLQQSNSRRRRWAERRTRSTTKHNKSS
ncbi:hypothetical protein QOT17_001665 [Balamuthia mandrillaris]